jgi:hypothetical protein
MAIIYNDPPSGTYKSTYGSGIFPGANGGSGGTDPHWNLAQGTATTNFNIDSGAGGNLIMSAGSSVNTVIWRETATWTPSLSLWSEITLANGIGTSSTQEGPAVALQSTNGTSDLFGYIIRFRYNGSTSLDFTFYNYASGSVTAVTGGGPFTYSGGADILALQMAYNSSSSVTLTAFQNYVALGTGITDTTLASALITNANSISSPSGLWSFVGNSGFGDIKNMRGGTGLYPGSGSGPTAPTAATQCIVFP